MLISAATLGFLLAAGSAIFWASLDISRKQVGANMTASVAVTGLMFFQVIFFLPAFLIGELVDFKESGGVFTDILFPGLPTLTMAFFVPALISVVLNVAANWLFLKSVQLSPLSLTTPYLAFTPVFTAVIALFTLNQVPTHWGWVGIVIVVLGAFFMNPGAKEDGPLAPIKALWTERGSLLMLIVAMLWSITPILDKRAAEATSPLWHTFFLAIAVGTLFLIWCTYQYRAIGPVLKQIGSSPLLLTASGFFGVGAMVLQLSSYDYIDVAYVETIKRAIGLAAAIAAGYILFGERDIKGRLLGALVMIIGVALILLAG